MSEQRTIEQRFYSPGTEFNRTMTMLLKREFAKRGGLTIADSAIEEAVAVVAENTLNLAKRIMLENL